MLRVWGEWFASEFPCADGPLTHLSGLRLARREGFRSLETRMHRFLTVFSYIPILGLAYCAPLSASVVINEIHPSPDVKQQPVEFVELFNTGPNAVELSGWRFDDGIFFTFPAGTRMEPGQFLVVAGDPAAVAAKFRVNGVLGPWIGRLSGDGERLRLRNAVGLVEDEVDYGSGFPWPTVGESPGFSMELIHPGLDNDLGGHWRSSVAGDVSVKPTPLVASGARWRYWKGSAAPSTPLTLWRQPEFDDAAWESGAAPLGYDPDVAIATRFEEMRNGYPQFFLRGEFDTTRAGDITAVQLEALYDDGFKLWINGHLLFAEAMDAGEVGLQEVASGAARESNAFQKLEASLPPGVIRDGRNVVSVQVANINVGSSSDAFFDARLTGLIGPSGRGPSPGRTNVVFAVNAPPAARRVEHRPVQPRSVDRVVISARVTDTEGVGSVQLEYQVVAPGNYVGLSDPEFASGWTALDMVPGVADPRQYSAELPPAAVQHRNLIRYRIRSRDVQGLEGLAPLPDDPQPNFALFCHDGVSEWSGALRPGATGSSGEVFRVEASEMNRLPVYHLIAKKTSVENSTWFDRSHGDEYFWTGTLVSDGIVYDHIQFRPRGGVWRYAMGKNMWKFDFLRGHEFRARDNWGRPFGTPWGKLNLGACIQQGDTQHRGEQGLFEGVGFRLFQLLDLPAPHSTHVQFRIVDAEDESALDNQYGGDFWGVYLAVEQLDGRFLEEHGLPDGNLFKMEGGFGEPNNLGPKGPVDSSDLRAFLTAYNATNQEDLPDAWWRANLNLEAYYSYQTLVQAIHHYDIADGKNYFYYHHPVDGRWMVSPWDLDLTWSDNMYRGGQTGGNEPFKSRVLSNFSRTPARPALATEFRNRVREVRDLLWNGDEAHRLIDEQARLLRGTGPLTLLDVDRAQWDYNPIMTNSAIVNTGKAGQGRFYRFPSGPGVTRDFAGAVRVMKNYVGYRATNATFSLDTLSAEPLQPARPGLAYAGPEGFPVNRLSFRVADFQGAAAFRSVKWRVAEISRMGHPAYDPNRPMAYEIQSVWESDERTSPVTELTVPVNALHVGRLYRARVRYTDAEGRTSHWSPPVEFTAGAPVEGGQLTRDLQLTEVMYNPASDGFEYVELQNTHPTDALRLDGAAFIEGITFTFPAGSVLAPGAFAVVVRTTNTLDFLAWHDLPPETRLWGPYQGALENSGESVVLRSAAGGGEIFRMRYSDDPPWPVEADGGGHSLVPQEDGAPSLSVPAHWRASLEEKGSPGRTDPNPTPRVEGYRWGPSGLEVTFVAGSAVSWVAEVSGRLGDWAVLSNHTGPAIITIPVAEASPARFVRGVVR
ncbi:MAG: hypothetical protein RIS76_4631 [Verrucomicrobiota bacterium]